MNYLESKLIKERLPKKGFKKSDNGKFWHLEEYDCVQIQTSSINDIGNYDTVAIRDISKSLKLTLEKFQELIECKIDKDNYYKTFIEPKLKII